MVDDEDWRENRLYIRSELRSLREDVGKVNANLTSLREKDLSQIRVDIAMLQVKSGLWGAMAGALVVLVPIIAKMFG